MDGWKNEWKDGRREDWKRDGGREGFTDKILKTDYRKSGDWMNAASATAMRRDRYDLS